MIKSGELTVEPSEELKLEVPKNLGEAFQQSMFRQRKSIMMFAEARKVHWEIVVKDLIVDKP